MKKAITLVLLLVGLLVLVGCESIWTSDGDHSFGIPLTYGEKAVADRSAKDPSRVAATIHDPYGAIVIAGSPGITDERAQQMLEAVKDVSSDNSWGGSWGESYGNPNGKFRCGYFVNDNPYPARVKIFQLVQGGQKQIGIDVPIAANAYCPYSLCPGKYVFQVDQPDATRTSAPVEINWGRKKDFFYWQGSTVYTDFVIRIDPKK